MRSIIPRAAEQAKIRESFDYANHVKNSNDIGVAGGIALQLEESAMFRKKIESQQAAMEQAQSRGNNDAEME